MLNLNSKSTQEMVMKTSITQKMVHWYEFTALSPDYMSRCEGIRQSWLTSEEFVTHAYLEAKSAHECLSMIHNKSAFIQQIPCALFILLKKLSIYFATISFQNL